MNSDQVGKVALTYRRFVAVDAARPWGEFDDIMRTMDYMSDDEMAKEADIAHYYHSRGNARCESEHPSGERCAIPEVVEAIGLLLDHYVNSKSMDSKMRYMLQFYVAMDQSKMIVYDLK